MAFLSKRSFVWIIVLSFLGIILVPGIVQSPSVRNTILGVFGSICLLFQFLNLSAGSTERSKKSDLVQGIILIVLTITLLVVNFLV